MGSIRDRDGFLGWLDGKTPWFSVVQGIANGSKHFASKQNTKSSATYVENGYVEPGYQKQYLEIEVDGKWIEAIIVIEEMVMFWEQFFTTYRHQAKLPQPRNPFTRMPE